MPTHPGALVLSINGVCPMKPGKAKGTLLRYETVKHGTSQKQTKHSAESPEEYAPGGLQGRNRAVRHPPSLLALTLRYFVVAPARLSSTLPPSFHSSQPTPDTVWTPFASPHLRYSLVAFRDLLLWMSTVAFGCLLLRMSNATTKGQSYAEQAAQPDRPRGCAEPRCRLHRHGPSPFPRLPPDAFFSSAAFSFDVSVHLPLLQYFFSCCRLHLHRLQAPRASAYLTTAACLFCWNGQEGPPVLLRQLS